MSSINAKSLAAIAVAAILAGAAAYLAQKQKVDRLQSQMDDSLAQLQQAKADAQAARQSLAAQDQELQKLRTASTDLARTRNEIAQLRQQRAAAPPAARAPANPAARSTATGAYPPGTYFSREQANFAGFATPEATLQSLAWAGLNGQTNVVPRVVPADLPQAQQLVDELQQSLQVAAPVFQGMQIVAEKTLPDGQIEVLVKIDSQTVPGGEANAPPPFNIVPMAQVDNEWKITASPIDYSSRPDWANTGQVKTFAP
jgi:hypothetical protein